MSGAGDSEAKGLAADLAERVDQARADGEQLGLFGEPDQSDRDEAEARKPGRPKGARNKAKIGLAEYMAAKGWRAPAQQLAFLAGLNSQGLDAFELCYRRTEWIARQFEIEGGSTKAMLFLTLLKEMRLAADALTPYTAERLAPAQPAPPANQRPVIGIQLGVGASGAEPQRRIGPPPMPSEIRERNQDVSDAVEIRADGRSDGE